MIIDNLIDVIHLLNALMSIAYLNWSTDFVWLLNVQNMLEMLNIHFLLFLLIMSLL